MKKKKLGTKMGIAWKCRDEKGFYPLKLSLAMAVMINKNESDEQQGFSTMIWILMIQEKEEK